MLSEPHEFDFFQAIWILERLFGGDDVDPSVPSDSRIRIRPHAAQVFPPSDVRSVELTDEGALVTATFMGLYGIGSPMPDGFDGDISKGTEDSAGLRDFLDIFNNRLYWYFYRAWQRHHPGHDVDGSSRRRSAAFLGLAGVATKGSGAYGATDTSPMRVAAFSGQLGGVVRNAEGLASIVSEMLGLPGVHVLENVPRRVPMANRPQLGGSDRSPMRLGKTSTIGKTVFDVSGKFRIVVGPVSLAEYSKLLPGHPDALRLASIVALYAPDNLDYDVELLLDVGEVPPLSLGNSTARLGRNTWLGQPTGQVVAEVVRYD
ncbi:MAG: type VI secretion system baseplate subunit TssG [Rhodothermales bacterium]|nr:type VI secretion system baseplate subunit TssG [Rhodothermales bacterium]